MMKYTVIFTAAALALGGCTLETINDAASAQKKPTPPPATAISSTTTATSTTPVARTPIEEPISLTTEPTVLTTETPALTTEPAIFSGEPLVIDSTPVVAQRATIQTTGVDSCGAADYAFLVGEPFATTFDVALPPNAQVLGRSQSAEGANPARMLVRVSTRSGASAVNTPTATITQVVCG